MASIELLPCENGAVLNLDVQKPKQIGGNLKVYLK